MTTIKALKKLTSVIVGGNSADIPGETVPEVIEYLANNYPMSGTVTELTITSTPGSTFGTTKITVTPKLTSGNKYAYKISPSTVEEPAYYSIPTGVTEWDGVSEIEAEDSHHIGLYELNSEGRVIGFGDEIVAVNLG